MDADGGSDASSTWAFEQPTEYSAELVTTNYVGEMTASSADIVMENVVGEENDYISRSFNEDGEEGLPADEEGIEGTAEGRRSSSFAHSPFLGGQSSGMGSDGIHSMVFFLLTKPDERIWKVCAALFLSWIVLYWQLFIFGFLVIEILSLPPCKIDGDCSDGFWCDSDSGFCDGDGVNCPFLENSNSDNRSTRFAIIFIFVYIVGLLIEDMDQNSRTSRAGKYRLENHCQFGSWHHRFVSFNMWGLYYVRAYLVPYATFVATIAMIYAEDVTAQAVILNGLAVSFIGCTYLPGLISL
jgi:hypothetical protein